LTERQLLSLCLDLFVAGTETSATTLTWAIILLSLNQDIQYKIHREIDNIIGSETLPRMDDRKKLPFTEASILEIQRLADIVPLGIPHAVTEDVQFRGYFIPKGTLVLSNMYSVHMNPELWPEPEKFKPERFLQRGMKVEKKELIPFSVGKIFKNH